MAPAAPDPPRQRAGTLARIAGYLMWLFAAGFVIGAVQVWVALRSGKAWANFRGELIGHDDMVHTLGFMIVGAAALSLLAWRWQRALRRGSSP